MSEPIIEAVDAYREAVGTPESMRTLAALDDEYQAAVDAYRKAGGK